MTQLLPVQWSHDLPSLVRDWSIPKCKSTAQTSSTADIGELGQQQVHAWEPSWSSFNLCILNSLLSSRVLQTPYKNMSVGKLAVTQFSTAPRNSEYQTGDRNADLTHTAIPPNIT